MELVPLRRTKAKQLKTSYLSFSSPFPHSSVSLCAGCLSTGKEANVYYARGGDGRELAVKIFKTSILVFKDRDKYVSGEFRFRNGYCKSNPRKMVKTWAEKEMRNLKRLRSAGIPVPEPHLLKSHLLVMDFLGDNGWCAPRLKDAVLSVDEMIFAYKQIVVNMRIMYQECRLVHGDLSEYNLLWYRGSPRIIDVSQSVEHSHPFSIEFLRKDIGNVTDFFSRKGLQVLSKMALFHYIVDKDVAIKGPSSSPAVPPGLSDEEERLFLFRFKAEEALDELMDETCKHADNLPTSAEDENKADIDEAVFMQAYIPTSLSEIANPYAELQRIAQGGREKIYKEAIESMIAPQGEVENEEEEQEIEEDSEDEDLQELLDLLRKPGLGNTSGAVAPPLPPADPEEGSTDKVTSQKAEQEVEDGEEDKDNGSDEDDSEDSDSDESSTAREERYRRQLPSRDQPDERAKEKADRKEARKLAKAEKALKRQHKIPKHVKKRAMKTKK